MKEQIRCVYKTVLKISAKPNNCAEVLRTVLERSANLCNLSGNKYKLLSIVLKLTYYYYVKIMLKMQCNSYYPRGKLMNNLLK